MASLVKCRPDPEVVPCGYTADKNSWIPEKSGRCFTCYHFVQLSSLTNQTAETNIQDQPSHFELYIFHEQRLLPYFGQIAQTDTLRFLTVGSRLGA